MATLTATAAVRTVRYQLSESFKVQSPLGVCRWVIFVDMP